MRRIKIYLDTSVISHLDAPDRVDWMNDTHSLWHAIKNSKFEVLLSRTTFAELEDCPEPKRSALYAYISEIEYTMIEPTNEVQTLADAYIASGILSAKSADDAMHIAFAVTANCDYIVSWNFKHLVNVKTINGVKSVNAVNNYKEISIVPPTMLLEGGENE